MPSLLNELTEVEESVLLVLDDYHAISREVIHHSVGYFIDHLPQGVQLALATRADPRLPLVMDGGLDRDGTIEGEYGEERDGFHSVPPEASRTHDAAPRSSGTTGLACCCEMCMPTSLATSTVRYSWPMTASMVTTVSPTRVMGVTSP